VSPAIPPAAIFAEAGPEDLPAIAELAAIVWRRHYPGIITRAQIDYMLERMYALETMRREVAEDGICYERLVLDGSLVGFGAFGPGREPGLYKLHKLYLHPDQQGRGLGSLLLRHCEAKVRRLGGERIELQVNKRNTSAIETYRRNGYHVAREAVFDIGGGFVMDDFIMEKSLAAERDPVRR
jgi:ribosomal protein S18 acetylase RimI-like enzyme